jgi:GNAT superfamily N-acetyltransferase
MPADEKQSSVKIRRAHRSDAARLAVLASELGYPTTTKELRARFDRLTPAASHAVFVAQNGEAEVIGWVHVSVTPMLEVPLPAEINGLIVAEGHRSSGAGARLLDAAEHWARKKKCRHMSVRSNVIRERAHRFYVRQGYEHYKTAKAFRKPL